jgi:hypothetical protein
MKAKVTPKNKLTLTEKKAESKLTPKGELGEVVTVMQMHNVNLPYEDRVWWDAVEHTAPKFKGAGSIPRRHVQETVKTS